MPNERLKNIFTPVRHFKLKPDKVWFFPGFVLLMLMLLTALGVSGSSINIYDRILKDPAGQSNLIAGEPRTVRSDEWLVNTPYVLSQVENNFPVINSDLVRGQDMTVVADVPYKEWSTVFRPQNLGFFALPAENAFAFKWWFLAALLMIATYLFVLTLMPRKIIYAVALSIFMLMSPFIQWWYQSATILPIAYSLLSVVIAFWIINRASFSRRDALMSLLLFYVLTCFIFVMYPPFQIICAGLGLLIMFALVFSKSGGIISFLKSRKWLYLLGAGIGALVLFILFIFQHASVVETIRSTVYPGERTVQAGGMPLVEALTWPINYVTLNQSAMTSFGNNQSEVSNYLFIGLLFIPLLAYHFYVNRKNKNEEYLSSKYLFIAVLIGLGIISMRAFVPIGDVVYGLFQLNTILAQRLWIGIGIINLVLLILALRLPTKKWTGVGSLICIKSLFSGVFGYFVVYISLLFVKSSYELPGIGLFEIAFVSLIIGVIVGLISHSLVPARYTGLVLLLAFAVFTSASVNPLYKGFGALNESQLTRGVEVINRVDDSKWISTRNIFGPFILAGGAPSLSGVEAYPQLSMWQKYFPGKENIYNRYAHVTFDVDDSVNKRTLSLIQSDAFTVRLNSCDLMLKQENVNYVIDTSGKEFQCFKVYSSYMVGDTPVNILRRVTP